MTEPNSHRFFCNPECRYFPCHETDKPDEFNCLFCFCPLYFLNDCGGKGRLLESGIKDCTGCMVPHAPGGYDHVMARLREKFDAIKSETLKRKTMEKGSEGCD
ncbi:MAG: cysteine-rich small domain-containing protein [Pseudomonadota bacterium]